MEASNFGGCLYLFFIGTPILVIILIFMPDETNRVIMLDIHKFTKGEQIQHQLRLFLEVIDNLKTDRNNLVILKAYVHIFEETCITKDCELKRYKKDLEQGKEGISNLLHHALFLFQLGISKFPNCTSLRVAFAFFLLERFHNKKRAQVELMSSENFHRSFDEEFIIYRYNKILEEQIEINDEGGENDEKGLDDSVNINYQNHFNLCKYIVILLYLFIY